ncbi:MAG: segregation/condensation protein A [Candidatus Sungbacteria bacterium]|uniref:Segregation and condensation protein A n=1 Tax=Candidatus Sungiibacteriota bacterium TaxID=2750080 RepID=A0A932VS68_9BACT|nr:segregation/condensation protein A [Candidatus Sungbacteria bacterium]
MSFRITQEKFEGPLELLAELIERRQLAISEISLGRVADEYLAHVRSLEAPDPEELAGFLVIASQLMLVKSRSLLPDRASSEDEESSLKELETRVREYQKFRELAREIRKLESRGLKIVSREAYRGLAPVFYPPPRPDEALMERVFSACVAAIPRAEKLAEEKVKRIISLEEKIAHIRALVQGAVERGFSDIVHSAKEKADVIVSFLALLELARQKFVDINQEKLFADIMIKKLP